MWLKLLRSLYLAARRVLLGTGISFIPPFSWIKKAALRGLRSSGRVPVLGSWMRRDPGDRLNLAVNGVYEPIDTAFVGRVVQPGDTVVDVGANIGYYTCYLARLVGPKGHVLAFEPAPDLIDILRDNVAFNGYENVQIENKAVTDKSGPLTLYMEEGKPEDTRIFKDTGDSTPRSEHAVEGVRLDDVEFLRSHPPMFIKIDVQGAEIFATRGMRRVLKESLNVCVLVEYWPYGFIRAGARPEELVEVLKESGLDVCRVTDEGKLKPVNAAQLKELYGETRPDYLNLVAAHGPRMESLRKEFA
jgi:FkbM family methyltransferase